MPHIYRLAVCIALLAGMFAASIPASAPASAQNAQLQTLIQRLDRMGEDLRILQKDYYRGQKTGASRLQAGQSIGSKDGGRLADAEIRMSNLEADMRRLTGQLEEVRHGMATMLRRLDGLVKDVDFRLTEIERGIAKAPGRNGTAPVAGSNAPPGTLGATASLGAPATSAKSDQRTAAGSSTVLPQGTPIEQYNYAYSLLTKMQLQDAEAAFQEFLAQHGEDPLAGNAQYWLGETYYARQNLAEAARAFLTGIQRYPNSAKAPDSLLKLGISLSKLGKMEDACAAFLEMQRKFTSLRTQVRKRMLREMKAVGCS